MPSLTVDKKRILTLLEKEYSDEEFGKLLANFGMELDGIAEEDGAVKYKVDLTANRADLVSVEGLAQSLNIFTGNKKPYYNKVKLSSEPKHTLTVKKNVGSSRPYALACILRGINFENPEIYASFIDFQDKLHQNICRNRRLVAIGTHDLDCVEPEFSYQHLTREEINFTPLNREESVSGVDFVETMKSDRKLSEYIYLIENEERFPCFLDGQDRIMSLPPIINSEFSKIRPSTKNVFIDMTATDLHRAHIVMDILVTTFSQYCSEPFTVEPVKVVYEASGEEYIYPQLIEQHVSVPKQLSRQFLGVCPEDEELSNLLGRMNILVESVDEEMIHVLVPPTRNDVLHPVDIVEDIAVAIGLNNLPQPNMHIFTEGKLLESTLVSDEARKALGTAGLTEFCSFTLVSEEEAKYSVMTKPEDTRVCAVGNAKSNEYAALRSSVLVGLLKAAGKNNTFPRPLGAFEVGDVMRWPEEGIAGQDMPDVHRRAAVLLSANNAPFSEAHGIFDHLNLKLRLGYTIQCDDDAPLPFLSGRCAKIMKDDKLVGRLGVIHPKVLVEMDIAFPCAAFEVELM